jgi:hypothetical protein
MPYPGVDMDFLDEKEHRRKLAQAVNGLLLGQSNNVHSVTLTANATSTVLTRVGISPLASAFLSPMSASAAASLALVWASVARGEVTIHHDSSPATDRTFGVLVSG